MKDQPRDFIPELAGRLLCEAAQRLSGRELLRARARRSVWCERACEVYARGATVRACAAGCVSSRLKTFAASFLVAPDSRASWWPRASMVHVKGGCVLCTPCPMWLMTSSHPA